MNITPEQRDAAIEKILSEGLAKQTSTWVYLRDMPRNIGLKVIFKEGFPGIIVSLAFAAFFIISLAHQAEHINLTNPAAWNVYALLFLLSPALFMALTFLTEAVERFGGMYELKMTSRYTLRHITAFRLLGYSLCGTVFAMVCGVTLLRGTDYAMLTDLLSLSLCSLFLCTLLIIHLMRRLRNGWYLGTIIWSALGVLPMVLFDNAWNILLSNLPPAVALGIAGAALGLFLREIKITAEGNKHYAYS